MARVEAALEDTVAWGETTDDMGTGDGVTTSGLGHVHALVLDPQSDYAGRAAGAIAR